MSSYSLNNLVNVNPNNANEGYNNSWIKVDSVGNGNNGGAVVATMNFLEAL